MGRSPPLRPSGLLRQALLLAHRFALYDDGVRIVDDTVADDVSQGGFADFLVPAAHVELGTEDGGSLFAAAFGDLQQVAGLGVLEWVQQPFVQDEAACPRACL